MMTNTPRKLLVIGAGMSMLTAAHAQDLEGAYGAFTRSTLEAAAFDAFGEGMQEEDLTATALRYFKYGVRVDAEFNDNIFNSDVNTVSDTIIRVDVPLALENERTARHHVALHYTPTFKSYIDNSSEDGIDHHVGGRYVATLNKTTINVNAGFAKVKSTNRFASGNIGRKSYSLSSSINHQLTGKTSVALDFGAYIDTFPSESLTDRERYNVRLSSQYQITGKSSLGPYIGYEHVDNNNQPDQDAFSFGARASYQALGKTTFTGYAGVENRQFQGGGVSDRTTPTFELAANHELTGKTDLTGTLYNTVRASYSDVGRSYKAFGFSAAMRHRMTQRISLKGMYNLEYDDYFSTIAGATGNPDTLYNKLSVGGSYLMDNGFTLGTNLSYTHNDAGENTRDYQTWRFNVNAGYQF